MKNKLVTNLLTNISRARDLLDEGDFDKIYNRLNLFAMIENDISIQLGKFTKDKNYELDFNHEDLKALSYELHNYIKDYPEQFKYHNILEDISKLGEKITVPMLNDFGDNLAKKYKVDTYLRSLQKVTSYFATVVYLYSNSEERKPFDVVLTEHIRSFI